MAKTNEKKILIGIIESNDYSISDYIPQKNTYEDLYEFVSDIVELKSVPESQIMDEIIRQTGMEKHSTSGGTTKIYDNDKIIIDMCYAYDKTSDDVNNLAEIARDGILGLLNPKDTIRGNAVCIKSSVDVDGKCKIENISLSDITNAIHRKIVKRAVILNPPNEIVHYDYVMDPVEMLSEEERNNFKYISFPFLGNSVKLFVEIEPSNNTVNELGSGMFYKHIVSGRCILTMSNDKDIFLDIDKECNMAQKIIRVLSDRSVPNEFNEKINEDKESNIMNGIKIINNFGRLLANRARTSRVNDKFTNIMKYMENGASENQSAHEIIKMQISNNELIGPQTETTEENITKQMNELSRKN